MDGILNIHKPPRITSHDVVLKVRTITKEKRIGHTGTLDPLATGVLVLCLGKATRIARYLEAGEKEYQVVMRLGITTDTLDAEGHVLAITSYTKPETQRIVDVLQGFKGTIMQQPPAYSAIKVSGVPSYKLARKGEEKPLAYRSVYISHIELTSYEDPFAYFTVRCSKGTYVRTLCADAGKALGMGAHVTGLVRTRSGHFTIDESVTLDELCGMVEQGCVEQALTSSDEALSEFPALLLDEDESKRVVHGNHIPDVCAEMSGSSNRVRLHDPTGRLLAIARIEAGMLKPEIVFS
jgi:tRNA pseudouridine55 synthase